MATSAPSLWRRFINLFTAKATQQIEKHETPEVLATQKAGEIKKNVKDFEQGVVGAIAELRKQETRQNDRFRELRELENKIEGATRTYKQKQAEGATEAELDVYARLLEAYVAQNDVLVEDIEEAQKHIDPLSRQVEALKGEFQSIKLQADRDLQEIERLKSRASTASALEKAAEITSSSFSSQVASLDPLRDKVVSIEARAVGIRELEMSDPEAQRRRAEAEIARNTRSNSVQNLLEGGSLRKPKTAEITAG